MADIKYFFKYENNLKDDKNLNDLKATVVAALDQHKADGTEINVTPVGEGFVVDMYASDQFKTAQIARFLTNLFNTDCKNGGRVVVEYDINDTL